MIFAIISTWILIVIAFGIYWHALDLPEIDKMLNTS